MKSLVFAAGFMNIILFTALPAFAQTTTEPGAATPLTVDNAYPGMATAGLTFATLDDLPDGVLLRSGAVDITAKSIEEEIAKAPEDIREGLNKNAFFILEKLATKNILIEQARRQAIAAGKDAASQPDQEILDGYLDGIAGGISATDEEIAKFYEDNKDACGGATLDQMKEQLAQYVVNEKQQTVINDHIKTLGQRTSIVVSSAWMKEKAATAKDNPVDKARESGIPTLVDFGADGCRACDMMTPILATLEAKYEGKANILFVDVREEEILAARYGIQSIPVQVFFDKDGKEITRNTGFFPREEIEKQFSAMGVR